MVVLSVIIVNYNVRYFLEQCLCAVKKAIDNANWPQANAIEVFVVDNNSTDGSLAYLQPKFPFVQFIVNTDNPGFAKANNQALAKARGQHILFLNPDTIIPEDTFTACVHFMQQHTDAGALGVHMIDGSGLFLKESKRGFPSPWVSFGKMSGLIKLFPSSKLFARYYLGHLPETKSHIVDALSGAFMLVKKEVLDKTGGFDEQFFMYAEDIDLSYRIQQAGYHNYYFADCTIIHFKGESTRKDAKYVQLFYKAMIQFVRKHFRGNTSKLYIWLLEAAIKVKAKLAKGNQKDLPAIKEEVPPGSFLLTGDEHSKQLLKAHLNGKVLASNAEARVMCEGATFSFKEMIGQLQSPSNANTPIYIYTPGAGSLISSPSKENQGSTIIL
ncbi:MAG: glycosyltransferase family 2 protein [Chitinophagaceae bacterium]